MQTQKINSAEHHYSLLFNNRLKVHKLHTVILPRLQPCFIHAETSMCTVFSIYLHMRDYHLFYICFLNIMLFLFFLIPCYIIFSLILSVYIYLKSCYIVIISKMTISYIPSFLSLLRFILLSFISCNESALLDVCVFLFT